MNKKGFSKIGIFITLIIVLVLIFGVFKMTGKSINSEQNSESTEIAEQSSVVDGTRVILETNHGEIVIELYGDMPITSGNFEKLVSEGFYDGVIFHRIINGFIIQGGDPDGTGMGGPGYDIKDEFVEGRSNLRGTISMANSGPNSGGSQFFINLVDNTPLDYDKEPLTSKHPAFGEVVEGIDIVDKIAKVQVDGNDRPLNEVKIIKARVL